MWEDMNRSDLGSGLTDRASTLNPKTCMHKAQISSFRLQPLGSHIPSPGASLLIYRMGTTNASDK